MSGWKTCRRGQSRQKRPPNRGPKSSPKVGGKRDQFTSNSSNEVPPALFGAHLSGPVAGAKRPREETPAGGIRYSHEDPLRMAGGTKGENEGFSLTDNNAVIGLSRLNPLPKTSAVNKSSPKKPNPVRAKPVKDNPRLGVAAAPPFKPKCPAACKPIPGT